MADEPAEADASNQPPPKRQVVAWEPLTLSHLLQISAGLAGTLALLRLAAVAEGDPQLATAMLQATGYVAPFIQMALSFVPILVILIAAYAIHYRRIAKRAGRNDLLARYAWLVVIWAFILLAFVTPWIVLLIGAIVVTAVMVPAYFLDWRRKKRGESVTDEDFGRSVRRQLTTIVIVVVSLTVLGSIANARPWLPEEKVTFADGVVNGYVLNVGTPWTTILVDNPRYLKYVKTIAVTSREVCNPTWNKTLIQLLPAAETVLPPPGC